jgi:TonB-linked SusC/RagA family outer membrane protein
MTNFYLLLRRCIAPFLLLFYVVASAQTTVTGKVSDSNDGSPVPGVNILEKGTGNGTTTDANGNYSISVGQNATLVFSFIGYATQEAAVSGRSTVDVSLQSDVTALSEVVVIGYGDIRKKDVTGAVASLKSEDFNRGIIASPEQLIQGRTAGVNVTNASGEPGGGVTIRIRGTSSVRGGNNPLFVVDGVPLAGDDISSGGSDLGRGSSSARNPLNFINPGDIESIDILKDASATAIYGSRGANGVVLITTKSGRGNKKQLEFTSTFNVSQQAKYFDLLNADEFLQGVEKYGGDADAQDFGGDTDWQREITRSAFSQKYDLAYSNNYETGYYRASISYDNQQGVIKESGLERFTGRFNLKNNFLNDRLHFTTQLTYSRVDDEYAPITDNAGFEGDLLGSAYMANPTWLPDPTIQPSNTNVNPLSLLKYHQDNAKTNRSLLNFSLDYDILSELNFRVNVGLDNTKSTRGSAYSPELFLTNGVFQNGRASVNEVNTSSNLLEAFFNYKKNFENSNINAVLGYSYQEFNRSGVNTQGWGFATNDMNTMIDNLNSTASAIRDNIGGIGYQGWGFTSPPNAKRLQISQLFPTPTIISFPYASGFATVKSVAEDTYDQTDELQSFFGRINYTLKDKYLFTATLRADGSTRFGGNNKYGFFPSAAAAWRLSDEDFIPEFFDDLKLRAGYGITGNQEIPHNLYQARQRYGGFGINQGGEIFAPGLNDVAFANPDLKWEETKQLNFGLDFGFIKGRLNGTIDYYSKVTTDLLIQVNSAQPAPQPFQWQNLPAEIVNNGLELTLNYTAIDKADVGLNIGFNISYNDNIVRDFDGIVDTGGLNGQGLTGAFAERIQNDQPLYAYYLREFVGFDENGFNIYNGDFQKFVGKSPIPKYYYGFNINFRYKNFDALAFVTGQTGHYVYSNTANAYFSAGSLGNARNVTKDVLNSNESNVNAPEPSTRFLEKGDFMRLQNLNVGYNFNVDNTVFKRLYLYVGGQNLLLLTKYSGLDPEVNTNKSINGVPSLGIDYTAYPRARTFILGLNATF